MNFAKHGTFYIRNGWLRKALMAITNDENASIFSPANTGQAIDELGIGRVMVTSLRYWLDVLELADERKGANGIIHTLTEFGSQIFKYDQYLERKGTLWLLHYKMATSEEKATTWYWFFNEFKFQEFDETEFIDELNQFANKFGSKDVAESSLKKDFLCLKNTYLFSNSIKIDDDIEEAISCPFRELRLLSQVNSKKIFRKNRPNINELAPEVFYYSILDKLSDEVNQVSIEDIAYKNKMPGKVFNLTLNSVYELLHGLENKKYIKVNKKFGHNFIEIIERDKSKILKSYYSNHYMD